MAVALYYAKVVYNANGGSGAPAAQTGGTEISGGSVLITLSSSKPSRQYYTFNGWAYSSGASSGMSGGTTISCNASTTLYVANARVTNLYATWKPETAVLSYNANGGSGAPASQTVNKNTWFTLRTGVPTRSGYEFVGWNTSATATAATYQPGDSARIVGNMTLYAVWKVSNSTISSVTSSVEMNGSSTGTISISSVNSSYTHVATISLGSQSQTINFSAGQTSKTFTIPESWISEVTTSATGTATVSLKTYNGSTQVGGADTKTFSAVVPSSVVPTLSVVKANVNSNVVVDGWDILLQTFSQIKLTATASGVYGSTITNYTFSGDGLSQTGTSNEATSAILTTSGSRTWTIVVTDSRGRTATVTVTATVHEYFSPSIESLTAFRSDSNGNRDDAAGTYLKATGVFSYASCDSHNSLSVDKIEYEAEDAQSWTLGQDNVVSGNSYNFGGGLIVETKMFHVRLSLTDALGNSAQYVVDVAPIVGYGFGLKNDRVHFGGPCKEPGFVCDFDAKFEGVVDVVPRRAYATLSSSGWYRAMKLDFTGNPVGESLIMDIMINRSADYDSTLWECHSIRLVGSPLSAYFVNEKSNTTALRVSKVRLTHDGSGIYYVDIYTTSDALNTYSVDFIVGTQAPNYEKITAESLQSVASAPVGETILTTYTFIESSDGFTSYTALGKAWIFEKKNGIVYLNAPADCTSASAGTNLICTLPTSWRPYATTYFPVANYISGLCFVYVQTDGKVYLYTHSAISSARNCAFSGSWKVNS